MSDQCEPAHVVPRGSLLDSERFDLRVGRLDVPPATAPGEIVEGLVHNEWDLVIARCSATDISTVNALEDAGARLMDVHVRFERSATKALLARGEHSSITLATPEDAQEVSALFRLAFQGYSGHYHADPRLDDDRCTEIYSDWAQRLTRAAGRETMILIDRDPAGRRLRAASALTVDLANSSAQGVLDAVHPANRGHGLYARLGRQRLALAHQLGARSLSVSTHLQNGTTCRNLERLGFVQAEAQLTFHLWSV